MELRDDRREDLLEQASRVARRQRGVEPRVEHAHVAATGALRIAPRKRSPSMPAGPVGYTTPKDRRALRNSAEPAYDARRPTS